MPETNQNGAQVTRIKIKKLFRDCPKPSGWFACYASIRGQDDIKVQGVAKDIQVMNGMELDAVLEWNDKKGEYIITEMTPVTKTKKGMTTYLASLPGVSRATAEKLARLYGQNALEKIKSDPASVQLDTGFSEKIMKALSDGVNASDKKSRLRRLLQGFSDQLIKRVDETWPDPEAIIKQDPYRLMEIPGISFMKADTIALSQGFDPLHPYRVNHGITYQLDNLPGNDTFIDLNDQDQLNMFTARLEQLLGVRFASTSEIIQRTEVLSTIPKDPPVSIIQKNGQKRLFLRSVEVALETVSKCVRTAAAVPYGCGIDADKFKMLAKVSMRDYEMDHNMNLTDEQKNAVITSAGSWMSVISGGPGRGKTTIVDCLAKVCANIISGTEYIKLLAPTGRAMNKLRSATKGTYETMTIDRLICSARAEREFQKDLKNHGKRAGSLLQTKYLPLNSPKTMFIIDESSMVDIEKMAALMDLFPLVRYCFVGDIDQLPPIGKGRFLRDLIACGRIRVSYLTVAQRNGGTILANATKIALGDDNLQWDFKSMPFFPQPQDNQEMLDFILEQYNEERQDCPDITELALLCPVRRGPVGVVALNRALQDAACPERIAQPVIDKRRQVRVFSQKGHPIQSTIYGDGTSGNWTRFRIGDIVMNTKNQYDIECVTYENGDYWNGEPKSRSLGIFNGDCGRIIAHVPAAMPMAMNPGNQTPSGKQEPHEYIVIQFFNGSFAEIDVTMGEFENFELGYAMTVHKSQGCEYQTVIYVSPNSLANMKGFAVRNLPYTGVTRAKNRVVVIGSKESVSACIRNPLPRYNTDFTERIN